MEKWDLLDNKRNKTGRFIYRGEEIPVGFFHQVVHICIFNDKGKLLIQKRNKNKNKWPSLWDLSCGGAVIYGEDSHDGAERELYEELGIVHDFSKDKIMITITYEKGFDDYFALIFNSLDLDGLKLQNEEVEEVKWASLTQIEDMIDKKLFVPYIKEQIKLLFLLKNSKSYIQEK